MLFYLIISKDSSAFEMHFRGIHVFLICICASVLFCLDTVFCLYARVALLVDSRNKYKV